MNRTKNVKDCAEALSRRICLDIKPVADNTGLSNIGTGVMLDGDVQFAVYWLSEDDVVGLEVANLGVIAPRKDQIIFSTTVISARTATRWRKLGFQYMDASGNAFINSQGCRIVSVGHQPVAPRSATQVIAGKTGKSFQPSGLRVIFSLLNDEQLVSSSLRSISEKSGVSLGSTSAIYKDLVAHGYIRKQGKHAEIDNKQQLIERWAELYPYLIRNKKFIGHFTSDDPGWWRNVEGLDCFQFGGEIAAKKLSNYLNPKDGLVYLNEENKTDFIRAARLRKIKDKENPDTRIDLYEAFWPMEDAQIIAPPLVIYSDLMETSDSRNRETASRIKDEFLD